MGRCCRAALIKKTGRQAGKCPVFVRVFRCQAEVRLSRLKNGFFSLRSLFFAVKISPFPLSIFSYVVLIVIPAVPIVATATGLSTRICVINPHTLIPASEFTQA